MKKYRFKAKSAEEAKQKAAEYFNESPNKIEIKVIKNSKKLLSIQITSFIFEARLIEKKTKDVNSFFDFIFKDDGVYLEIISHKGNGKPINSDEIIDYAIRKKIKEIDIKAVAESVTKQCSKTYVAPYQEEENIDESINVIISDDKMSAYIKYLQPLGGEFLEFDKVLEIVAENKVIYGIDKNKLADIFSNKEYNKQYKFAVGRMPLNGVDGNIEYNINMNPPSAPKSLEDGSVDYYEKNHFISVKEGETIATYNAPTKGSIGTNVIGEELSAIDGKDLNLPLGENVELAPDGVSIISKIAGSIEFKKGKITVSNLLLINGNVDISIGNIKYEGNVKVTGNVTASISIEAEGTIEILGTVEGVNIKAKEDVRLRRGVLGGGKGKIEAGNNIYAGFIENTNVFAKNNVYANSIIHSNVECHDSIYVKGGRGVIIGGRLQALNNITAKNVGSNANSTTVLEVGIAPNVRDKYNEVSRLKAKLAGELNYISEAIDLAKGSLSMRQKAIKTKLVKDKMEKKILINDYEMQMLEMEEIISKETDGAVNVLDTIFPGVTITIKTLNHIISTPISHTSFKIRDGKIKPLPLSQ